jgi:hypothetical protein
MMILTLEIDPDLETALRAMAAGAGLPPDRYVLDLLHERLQPTHEGPQGLPHAEAALLEQINKGLPPVTWDRYHALKDKRHAETFTPEEHEELIRLVNEVEIWNARRLKWVAELAQRRGMPFPELVKQLGLGAPPRG